jgi:hypothetical protein
MKKIHYYSMNFTKFDDLSYSKFMPSYKPYLIQFVIKSSSNLSKYCYLNLFIFDKFAQ